MSVRTPAPGESSTEDDNSNSSADLQKGLTSGGGDLQPGFETFEVPQKGSFVVCGPEHERDLYDSVNWKKPQNLGLFYSKALEAFTHRTTFIRATLYPFFGVYLNMPGHSYNAIFSVFSMFWSLKMLWAFVIDAKLVFGKARSYYMTFGWVVSILAYGAVVLVPFPKSYYGVSNCTLNKADIQNKDAPSYATIYIGIMSVAVVGVAMVDLTSDALVVDYTKREHVKFRGKSNAWAHICALFGAVLLYIILGVGLNSPAYGGNICDWPFTYQHILFIYLAISILGLINSICFTFEEPATKLSKSIIVTAKEFLKFLEFRVFQRCAVLFIMVPALLNAKSSALVKIRKNWAQVDPFMNSVNAIGTSLLMAFGMFIIQKFFLQKSWVKIFVTVKLYMIAVALIVETMTIFDIVRNQYFYFTEELFGSVAQGISVFIMVQLAAEISDDGLEALTFGVLMTNWTISSCIASMLGNLFSTPFNVIDDDRYLRDSMEDRLMVFGSVAVACCVNVLAIPVFIWLCPGRREQVHKQKIELGRSKKQARICVIVFTVAFIFTFIYNFLIMMPSTQCLKILGGKGCPKTGVFRNLPKI